MSWRSTCGDEASCFVRTRTLGRAEGPGMGKGIHAGTGRCSRSCAMGQTGKNESPSLCLALLRCTECAWHGCGSGVASGRRCWKIFPYLMESIPAGPIPGTPLTEPAAVQACPPRRLCVVRPRGLQWCAPFPTSPPPPARGGGALRACAVPRPALSWAVFTARARRPGLRRAEPSLAERNRAKPNRTEQHGAEPNGAEANRTEASRTEPSGAERRRAIR